MCLEGGKDRVVVLQLFDKRAVLFLYQCKDPVYRFIQEPERLAVQLPLDVRLYVKVPFINLSKYRFQFLRREVKILLGGNFFLLGGNFAMPNRIISTPNRIFSGIVDSVDNPTEAPFRPGAQAKKPRARFAASRFFRAGSGSFRLLLSTVFSCLLRSP